MNFEERRERRLRIARERHDRAAVAIMEGGRRHTPDPESPVNVRRYWGGLVWSTEQKWHAA